MTGVQTCALPISQLGDCERTDTSYLERSPSQPPCQFFFPIRPWSTRRHCVPLTSTPLPCHLSHSPVLATAHPPLCVATFPIRPCSRRHDDAVQYPKNFSKIASFLTNRSVQVRGPAPHWPAWKHRRPSLPATSRTARRRTVSASTTTPRWVGDFRRFRRF